MEASDKIWESYIGDPYFPPDLCGVDCAPLTFSHVGISVLEVFTGYVQMGRQLDFSAPTNSRLSLPRALSTGLIMLDLSAASMRAALVLIANARSDGSIDMLKPELERLAALRIDNGHRFLTPIFESRIDIPSDRDSEGVGDSVFESLDYVPGEQKRLAGIIRGQLSLSFRRAISMPTFHGKLDLDLDVLRRLGTVPGILIYLKIAALLGQTSASVHRIRLKTDDAMAMFGNYVGQAATRTVNAAGEESMNVSLGRIHRHLIAPGVRDLAGALEDYDVEAIAAVPETPLPGRAWSHVDVMVRRLKRVGTIKELSENQRQRAAYYNVRDKAKSDRSIGS